MINVVNHSLLINRQPQQRENQSQAQQREREREGAACRQSQYKKSMEYCYYALSGLALRAVDYVSDALVEREEAVVQTFQKPGTIGQHKNNVMAASCAIIKGEVPHAHLLQSIPRVKGATEFIRSITLTDKDAAIVAGLGNRALKNHKKKKRSKKLSNTARLKLIEYPRTLKAALQYVQDKY